ncbi:hypothetical protein SLEP1_g28961 [Rubroshorea leprosula]|uniref:beta-galactosidase n=1 Tax=Rubroshorea leprosula TaxID=152421 RepID=A0AAV5K402_9ROSI|nr:hypothetical protein SLEP1_g28961 [Rubroshorea leprosula]
MGGKSSLALSLLVTLAFWSYCVERVLPSTVTYDHNAVLVIDGKRRVLLSGSIHNPRSTPAVWPELIQKSTEGGLDVIETYVFWNYHEPVRRQYYFEGRFDLVKSVKTVQEAGLFVHLRIGPYASAEWNGTMGLLCSFQHFSSDIQIQLLFLKRARNEAFYCQNCGADEGRESPCIARRANYTCTDYFTYIVENEYGNVEWAYGIGGQLYVKLAAATAIGLNTTVPWVMCSQLDAPDPIINTCNGFYCDVFEPISPSKPKMWTESYTGWFLSFGYPIPHRPVEDLAFAVARF